MPRYKPNPGLTIYALDRAGKGCLLAIVAATSRDHAKELANAYCVRQVEILSSAAHLAGEAEAYRVSWSAAQVKELGIATRRNAGVMRMV